MTGKQWRSTTVYLVVHPTNRKWVCSPQIFQWTTCPHKNPIEITRVVGPTYDSWVVRHQVQCTITVDQWITRTTDLKTQRLMPHIVAKNGWFYDCWKWWGYQWFFQWSIMIKHGQTWYNWLAIVSLLVKLIARRLKADRGGFQQAKLDWTPGKNRYIYIYKPCKPHTMYIVFTTPTAETICSDHIPHLDGTGGVKHDSITGDGHIGCYIRLFRVMSSSGVITENPADGRHHLRYVVETGVHQWRTTFVAIVAGAECDKWLPLLRFEIEAFNQRVKTPINPCDKGTYYIFGVSTHGSTPSHLLFIDGNFHETAPQKSELGVPPIFRKPPFFASSTVTVTTLSSSISSPSWRKASSGRSAATPRKVAWPFGPFKRKSMAAGPAKREGRLVDGRACHGGCLFWVRHTECFL